MGWELHAYITQTADKIEIGLLTAIEENGSADFIEHFTEQADLSAACSMDLERRGDFVYNTMREIDERSQVNVKMVLDGQGLVYQTFIAGNELYVWGAAGKL